MRTVNDLKAYERKTEIYMCVCVCVCVCVCWCGTSTRLWVQILLEAYVCTQKFLNSLQQCTYIFAVRLPKLSSYRNRITPQQSPNWEANSRWAGQEFPSHFDLLTRSQRFRTNWHRYIIQCITDWLKSEPYESHRLKTRLHLFIRKDVHSFVLLTVTIYSSDNLNIHPLRSEVHRLSTSLLL